MKYSTSPIVGIISILYILFVFVAHAVYWGMFWEYSKTLIPYLQTWSESTKEFYWIVSYLLDEGLYIGLFAYFAFFNWAKGVYLLFSVAMLSNVVEYLKLYYSDGRPYFAFVEIEGRACGNKDFGRPSGHLYGATLRLTLLVLM